MAFTVTATQGGSPSNGMALRVEVITGAQTSAQIIASAGKTGVNTGGVAAHTASITTTQTGSLVYGTGSYFSSSGTATASGTTLIDNIPDSPNVDHYITFKAASLTGTPGATTLGFTTSTSIAGPGPAMVEILVNSTLAEDPSGPAVASTTAAQTVTTANFSPPPGTLLVALVTANGNTGVETMSMTDNLSPHLNWTEVIRNTATAGTDYAGVWIADVPPFIYAQGPHTGSWV